jgi:hypothetical protein
VILSGYMLLIIQTVIYVLAVHGFQENLEVHNCKECILKINVMLF